MIKRDPTALSPREAQIAQRLIAGDTTRQIAHSYGIGQQTVKNYVTVIYEKLGVQGRPQLLQQAHVLLSASDPAR